MRMECSVLQGEVRVVRGKHHADSSDSSREKLPMADVRRGRISREGGLGEGGPAYSGCICLIGKSCLSPDRARRMASSVHGGDGSIYLTHRCCVMCNCLCCFHAQL